MLRKTLATACGLVVVGGAAACGAGERESGASAVAADFSAAIEEGDAAAACALLAPETVEALVVAEGAACEASLQPEELPVGEVGEVRVWGERAQVRTSEDVLFLVELEAGWKVVAAGCTAQGERPYQCEVGGLWTGGSCSPRTWSSSSAGSRTSSSSACCGCEVRR